ncbi:putative orfan [Tupanvirus soda lake]|uniref:Orfan n=2 Tax=Tupanvirus TaxID=2094720 RepID=A0AC62ABS7_9VIRU|nr:putative orfan [Tupanvirus soda lake]QKU35204.1 putative orfan [Tupanvirus soda lake]
MGIQNVNRMDITICVDGSTPDMTDILSLKGVNLVNHDFTINFKSFCVGSEFITFKYKTVTHLLTNLLQKIKKNT